jgi:hypothetical protein
MPLNDLDTLRDMLAGINADIRRTPGLETAAELIEAALAEIARVEQRRLAHSARFDMRGLIRRKN